MKVVIDGKDWQECAIKHIEFDFMQDPKSEEDDNEDESVDEESSDVKEIQRDAKDGNIGVKKSEEYFRRYSGFAGQELSPFNLGVFQMESAGKEDVLRATKYIGIMPLMKKKGDYKKDNDCVIKISSRFGISPTDMLNEVLKGKDYYENPDMFKVKSYSLSQWKQLAENKDKEKVLFGVVTGIGEIELFSGTDGDDDTAQDSDIGIINDYGLFEIIDFVNKAKKLCRKNLKKQTQRVEENLNCKVKGRILVQKQIKTNVCRGQVQKIYCAYNQMSTNIIENQILKYTLYVCQHHEIGESLREDISLCMNALKGVSLKKCSISDFTGLKNNGAYREYKEVLLSAKRVLGRYAIDYHKASESKDSNEEPTTKLVNHKVKPFFIDMNLLFEYYCRALFRSVIEDESYDEDLSQHIELESVKLGKRLLFGCEPKLEQKIFKDLYIEYEGDKEDGGDSDFDESDLNYYYMTNYLPDIVIVEKEESDSNAKRHKKKVVAVIDAKYSDVRNSPQKRTRTHQILFYMNALGCSVGGLISPSDFEENNKLDYVKGDLWKNDNSPRDPEYNKGQEQDSAQEGETENDKGKEQDNVQEGETEIKDVDKYKKIVRKFCESLVGEKENNEHPGQLVYIPLYYSKEEE